MTEDQIHTIFLQYKNQLIKLLGRKPLFNDVIEKVGRKVLGPIFKGVYPQDMFPVEKVGYYVINTDTSNESGTHWVAVINTKKYIYVHDSYGRDTKTILKHIVHKAKMAKKTLIKADPDVEQKNSNVCGCIALAFLLTAKQLGINKALKI
jgi:hypothetical protein